MPKVRIDMKFDYATKNNEIEYIHSSVGEHDFFIADSVYAPHEKVIKFANTPRYNDQGVQINYNKDHVKHSETTTVGGSSQRILETFTKWFDIPEGYNVTFEVSPNFADFVDEYNFKFPKRCYFSIKEVSNG
ncbi:hypothetical protein ACI2JA_19820 [Alkalihalobacillus sp. NPDC078783]|uniref:hypothetical protein n=1 Tax=Streptomyces albidoflavus TaxID=1886 RepID=UPI0033D86015